MVRLPNINDLTYVLDLLNADISLSNALSNTSNFIKQYAKDAIVNERLLVLEIEDKVCGIICWDYIWMYTVPLVTWLYIKQDYRNNNYTNLLTSALYNVLRQKGYKRLLYGIHETVEDPSSISPHGYLEWPDKTKETFYWMKLA